MLTDEQMYRYKADGDVLAVTPYFLTTVPGFPACARLNGPGKLDLDSIMNHCVKHSNVGAVISSIDWSVMLGPHILW